MTLEELRHKENIALKQAFAYVKKVNPITIIIPPTEGADTLELVEEVRKLRKKLGVD